MLVLWKNTRNVAARGANLIFY